MTPDRFRHLTQAYGARPEHWPPSERAAAEALLAAGDPLVLAVFAAAQSLDRMLEADAATAIPAAPAALIERILASAPRAAAPPETVPASIPSRPSNTPRAPSSFRRPVWKRPGWWISGAGFVGAGMAGLVTGALAISVAASLSGPPQNGTATASDPSDTPSALDQSYSSTVFNSVAPEGNEQ
jgi:hypothetical protein